MPTIVYRIEHKEDVSLTWDGFVFPTGVFSTTSSEWHNRQRRAAIRKAQNMGAWHPHPPRDGLPRDRMPEYVFGFRSMSQLSSWFPLETWNTLHRAGFVVREYVCPRGTTRRGRSQVMFLYSSARVRLTVPFHVKRFTP